MKLALSAFWRPALEPRLPGDVEAAWFHDVDSAMEAVKGAKAAELDLLCGPDAFTRILEAGQNLEWIACCFAGIDRYPAEYIQQRGLIFTNGAGVTAVPVAEWAVMGVYALAKGFADVVRMHDRREWREIPYGTVEVSSSKVLLIGYGHIGKEIARQLRGVGADVTIVRSRADHMTGALGPDDWRPRLAEFDFVILAAPGTEENRGMIGADELRAMKKGGHLINIGRGSLVDQQAFVAAMAAGEITGALLDPTEPEPLPPGDPLWTAEHTIITSHLSGRSQTSMPDRVSDLFLDNLTRFREGDALVNLVDFGRGY
ncbi:D-2-hydroxyacid dehydrogenase [Pacificimonas sp. WHA3]|uniref:D-2-hydroxyacid dehydrogenase n=1 Tax=Pacificimonas pallii TaxID=2827236 RepID=A0ABS6SFU9_9SPHN|nr:D-2-hydroxyacid dehydrogenase [Pacificimonas pallii]MBV7257292.1 D-2-hydroxyacid dehydrogenase [Pacificimonas pallii]